MRTGCLGAHLARAELRVAGEESNRRIPDYWIKPGVELEDIVTITSAFSRCPPSFAPRESEALFEQMQLLKDKAEIRETLERYWYGEDRCAPEPLAARIASSGWTRRRCSASTPSASTSCRPCLN